MVSTLELGETWFVLRVSDSLCRAHGEDGIPTGVQRDIFHTKGDLRCKGNRDRLLGHQLLWWCQWASLTECSSLTRMVSSVRRSPLLSLICEAT